MQGLMSSYPLTLTHSFERAERLFGEKTMMTLTATGSERTTYADWADRTRRLAGALDGLGISGDGRVATFAWNTAHHLELYFAAPCSGRVLHTLNIRLFPEQISYIVDHAEDEVVFVDRSLVAALWPLVDGFTSVRHIVVMDDGAGDVPEDDRILAYEELLAGAEPAEFEVDDENRAAAMCYTSGTTGHPKGVVYSHRSSVLHSIGAMLADTVAVSERDVVMPVVPMFHANAWGLAHAGVMAGSAFAFPGPQMTPKAIAKLMEDEKVTLAAGVPTIWMGALDELDGRDVSSLRAILCGGSAVPKVLSEAYREKIGQPILHAWGMTETSPLGSVCRIKSTLSDRSDEELADVRSTQGIVTPLMECRIVEPGTTDELPWDGEARGELQVAGPWVAAGYYRDEEGTKAQFTEDGWLRTGDVATITLRGLHPPRRPHQGPRQVGRRVDLLGRARERDHGPPVGARGGGHRRARREVGRAAAGLRGGRGRRADRRRRAARVPVRPGGQVVDPRARRVHRRGAQDISRKVLQEDAPRAVYGRVTVLISVVAPRGGAAR